MMTGSTRSASGGWDSYDKVISLARVGPELQEALRRWAIPFEFNREIALLLLDDLPEEKRLDVWQTFVQAMGQGVLLPISATLSGRFAFSSYARDEILANRLADENARATYRRLNRLLFEHFETLWQESLARGAQLPVGPNALEDFSGGMLYLEQSLYHQFAYDAETAFLRFEQLFQEYEWLNAAAVCDRLLAIALRFEDQLPPGRQFWLGFYKGKLYDVMARSPGLDGQAALSHRQGERKALEVLLETLESVPESSQEYIELVAMVNAQLGNLAMIDGRLTHAAEHLKSAASHFGQIDAFAEELAALNNLGLVLMQQRRVEEAVEHYDEMRQSLLSRHAEDKYSLAVLLLNLGNAYAEASAHQEARAAGLEEVEELARKAADQFKQALETFEETGFTYGQALAAATLGRWFLLRGEYDEAIVFFEVALILLPEDAKERKEVEQWLELAQQLRKAQPQPESKAQVKLTEPDADERLGMMMYRVSRGLHQVASLLAIEKEYHAGWQELQTISGSTAQSESAEQLQQGVTQFSRGNFQSAIVRFQDACHLARRESNEQIELQALAWLPITWDNLGDAQKSIEASTRLLARARQAGKTDYEIRAVFRLAGTLAVIDLRGRWHEIKPILQESLSIARQLNNVFYETYHLLLLGDCAWKMGAVEQGYAWLQESLNNIQPDTEQLAFFRAANYQSLSGLMRQRSDYAEAVRYAEMAVGQAKESGNPYFLAEAQLTLAQADQARGEYALALQLTNEVLPQAHRMEWKGLEQRAEYIRSEISQHLGHADEAYAAASRALELAREIQMKEEEIKSLIILGQALLACGRMRDAEYTLRSAQRLSQERDYADHFQRAEELLAGCH